MNSSYKKKWDKPIKGLHPNPSGVDHVGIKLFNWNYPRASFFLFFLSDIFVMDEEESAAPFIKPVE